MTDTAAAFRAWAGQPAVRRMIVSTILLRRDLTQQHLEDVLAIAFHAGCTEGLRQAGLLVDKIGAKT